MQCAPPLPRKSSSAGNGAKCQPRRAISDVTRVAVSNPTAVSDFLVTTTVQVAVEALVPRDRDGAHISLAQEFFEHDVPWFAFPVLIEPARENAERFQIDQREVTVEDHEDAVDVDMTERKWDFETVFNPNRK